MRWYEIPLIIIGLVLIFTFGLWLSVHAQQWGFYRAKEVKTESINYPRELDYEYIVAEFDELSGVTETVIRQVYKVVPQPWTKIEMVVDENSDQKSMMRSNPEHPAFLGKDLRECYENGHIQTVIDHSMALYFSPEVDPESGQRIVKHVRLQTWLDDKTGELIEVAQNYVISGSPMEFLTPEQIEEILE